MFEKYPDVVSIEQVMEMLSIGRNTAYELLNTGRIRAVKLGRKFIIPKKSIIEFLG